MGKKEPSEEVDPLCLPLGTRVGPWRVTGFRGRGSFGALYRVEHAGREAVGPFALKLAISPRDLRFEHEAQLLSLIHSPHVPQFIDYGVWEHSSGAYPYLVMQLVDGAPLYEWAARRNPSEAQVVGLVTDVYPPTPYLEEPGSEIWHEGGPGPRPARELNPSVSMELEALISRLLAWAPEERFNGHARQAAEALEEVAHRARSLAARPLFVWGYEQNSCVRSPEAVQLAAQWDEASRQTLEQREAEKARAATALEQRSRSAFAPAWAAAGVAAFLVLVLMLVSGGRPRGEPQAVTSMGFRKDRSASVGDSAMSPASATPAPKPQGDRMPKPARPLPEKPLPGQRQPPCRERIETVLRGVCWIVLDAKPPCGNDAYEWEGKCYFPSFISGRQPTSNPPE